MNLFNKTKPTERVVTPSQSESETEELSPIPEVNELSQARQCLEDFNSDLQESSSLQQSAQKRVSTLNSIISKMELDVKALRRLEHENRTLSRNIVEVESKLAQKSTWASELDNKLSDLDRRHGEAREQLEDARASLAALKDQDAANEIKIVEQDRMIRGLKVKTDTITDQSRHAEHTAEKLRDALDVQSADLARKNREVVELQNSLEELSGKYERKSKQGDATLVELKNLRLDFNEIKSKHVELTGALENTRYDLKSQKNVFDDTIKRREEENLALKTRIDQLQTQVRIKENMAAHLDQEFITLRNELINERERSQGLEQRLRSKSEEVERNGAALVKSKIEFDELNAKFAATLEDFETLRSISQKQREKLERYASIGGVTGGQVLINTDPRTPQGEDLPLDLEDTENVTVLKTAKTSKKKS